MFQSYFLTQDQSYAIIYLLELTTLLFIADQGESFFLPFYKIGGLIVPFFFEKLKYTDETIKTWESNGPSLKKSKDVGEIMKSPSTDEKFIEILESDEGEYKLFFSESDKEKALEFLKYNNYYNFVIFPKLLLKSRKNSFNDALALFYIDDFIRKEVSYFSSKIEQWIKTSLAYSLSHQYESTEYAKAECYLDPNLYTSSRVCREILVHFEETINNSREEFIIHHHKNRNGCIPIWVLVEELTFGQIDYFISGLNSEYKTQWAKDTVGKEFQTFLVSWVSVVRHLRNIAAHHGRFYARKYTVLPKLTKEDQREYKIKKNEDKNTMFVNLLILKNLVSFHPNETIIEWNNFIETLDNKVEENLEIIDMKKLGFFEKWDIALKIL